MSTVEINNQNFEVHEEVAEQFSKYIRRSKDKDAKIADLQHKINKAISCVYNSHEDDIGYNVLCALGENP